MTQKFINMLCDMCKVEYIPAPGHPGEYICPKCHRTVYSQFIAALSLAKCYLCENAYGKKVGDICIGNMQIYNLENNYPCPAYIELLTNEYYCSNCGFWAQDDDPSWKNCPVCEQDLEKKRAPKKVVSKLKKVPDDKNKRECTSCKGAGWISDQAGGHNDDCEHCGGSGIEPDKKVVEKLEKCNQERRNTCQFGPGSVCVVICKYYNDIKKKV